MFCWARDDALITYRVAVSGWASRASTRLFKDVDDGTPYTESRSISISLCESSNTDLLIANSWRQILSGANYAIHYGSYVSLS